MTSMVVADENSGKRIGSTTKAAMGGGAVGGGIGGALSQIIVEVFAQNGMDLSKIEAAIAVVLTALLAGLGALLAGKATPTDQVRTEREIIPVGAEVATGVEFPLRGRHADKAPILEDERPDAIPEGTGSHRVEDGDVLDDDAPVKPIVIRYDQ